MAEVCVESREPCEPITTAARHRRPENRRFRIVAGAESMASSDESRPRKKTKNEASGHESDSVLVSDTDPRYGMTSVVGRRKDMEDAVSIRTDFLDSDSRDNQKHHFFGVFDGHGCSHVAALCRDRMHEIAAEELKNSESDSPNWKDVMETSFARMDAEAVAAASGAENSNCRCELQSPKCNHVGSTAVVAVVSSDRIVAANCGDSRVVLSHSGTAIPLSIDHKPDRSDELRRIEAAGGRVIYWDGARVLGVLAMSRAIGDCYLKPFVISAPEVTITDRTDGDECLILASDGLWDVVSNETACNIARVCLHGNPHDSDKACSDAAMLLTKLALARQSADNVSVVVVDLRRKS